MSQEPSAPTVQFLIVGENQVGQRLDNFLMTRLKGVPKSRIYRIIRKGEVRVNKRRVRPEYKLVLDDAVRVPPVRVSEAAEMAPPSAQLQAVLRAGFLFEDEDLLILNKPAGLPVHAGTGVKLGLIEALRQMYPEQDYLELVHRLDKGTSGCIMVARNAATLKALSRQLKQNQVSKRYHAIVSGRWPVQVKEVAAALHKNEARGGERRVEVSTAGKMALTRFNILRELTAFTLVEACPVTGRTHQIRVHAQSAGHPIAGDEKYNTEAANKALRERGVNRLCLHAAHLQVDHPPGQRLEVSAPYDERFEQALNVLGSKG